MRTASPTQLGYMTAPEVVHHLKVEVMNADGVFKDLTNLDGVDWVDDCTINGEMVDTQISTATIHLRRDITGGTSTAPLISGSPLNVYSGGYAPLLDVGRQVRISCAALPQGVAPTPLSTGLDTDFVELWIGRINNVQSEQDPITIECADFGQWLMDTQITAEDVFGGLGGRAVELVMQDIINTWPSGVLAVSLYTPTSPGWLINEYTQSRVHVMEAILALAQQIGWDVRYRYDASNSNRLTFFTVPRGSSSSLFTFGPTQYQDVTKFEVMIDNVRNQAAVVYADSTGSLVTRTATDAASVSKYGNRYIETANPENITNNTEADALAAALISDLSQPQANQEIKLPLFWPAQLGDLYTFQANGTHYDQDQKLGITGVKHEFSSGVCVTTLTCLGAIVGAYQTWLKKINPPTDVGPGLVAASLSFNATGDLIVNVNCESTVGSFKFAVDTTGTGYPSLSTVRAATAQAGHAGDFTISGPFTGSIAYVSILAYSGGSATGVESAKFDFQIKTGYSGPSLVVSATPGPTSWSIAYTYVADTVELSIDGGSFSTAPASPITVTLDATTHTYAFKAAQNNQELAPAPVQIPALPPVIPAIDLTATCNDFPNDGGGSFVPTWTTTGLDPACTFDLEWFVTAGIYMGPGGPYTHGLASGVNSGDTVSYPFASQPSMQIIITAKLAGVAVLTSSWVGNPVPL